ncbi:hypothetical protein CkaCkLH20_11115 [Colletotrichum karsti]|uniref:Uncharacterized protein n=1 Tax=Colletotrichum karsti TaxID=1095194 RepID=A0A9P6LFG9_9PEZI|nr:uncharacterized protein CkaCkLH20_11115 [Colletotrichum karsti]KAF9871468.1 hypothetical protein CkaCkLH20_11115 [Colletotrichum karsti]
MTYIFTERFRDIPSPLIIRVKLPVGYIGPEIEAEYLIEGDVEDFKEELNKNDVRTSRIVIMEEHSKAATSGKLRLEATMRTSADVEIKISLTPEVLEKHTKIG